MLTVTISRATASKCLIRAVDPAGTTVLALTCDPYSAAAQRKLFAGIPGLDLATLDSQIQQLAPWSNTTPAAPVTFSVNPPAAPGVSSDPFDISLRGLYQSTPYLTYSDPDPLACLRLALADGGCPHEQPVLRWSGVDRLAVLDIDLHHYPREERYTHEQLSRLVIRSHPSPVAWHLSHGGGAKLFFTARDGFTAEELASCAAVAWREIDGRATVEVKSDSRHPLYCRKGARCGPVCFPPPTADLSAVAAWLGRSADPADVEDFLTSKGWTRGQRLPHTECPIDPGPIAGADPVWVGDEGVICHRCAGVGRALGRRKPGWAPWPVLIGGADSQVYGLVKGWVHWAHAKHTLAHLTGVAESILRPAYAALLKIAHGPNDPRIPAVFRAKEIIRLSNGWVWEHGAKPLRLNSHAVLSTLPSTWKVERQPDGTTKATPDLATVQQLDHTDLDLIPAGYTPITTVRGVRMWSQFLSLPNDRPSLVVPVTELPADRTPRYVPAHSRPPAGWAWELLEKVFPGIDRPTVYAVMAGKACCEGRASQASLLYIQGPSGSGKSTVPKIAAAICGGLSTEIAWTADETALGMSILHAAECDDILQFDEIIKTGDRAGKTPRQTLDPFLGATPGRKFRALYRGLVAMQCMPLVVLTDTSGAQVIASDVQLARRIPFVRLSGRKDWDVSMRSAGLADPALLRLLSPEVSRACDTILSDFIDCYLREPTSFLAICAALGIQTMEHSTDLEHPVEALREFFPLVCDAPAIDPKTELGRKIDKFRKVSAGWKAVRRDYERSDELSERWAELCDNPSRAWAASRRCDEVDWGRLLGVKHNVVLDTVPYKENLLLVRFRVGPASDPLLVNSQILG